ncbi:MAG TPA: MoaD/ThiS family protein [Bacteroidetes bacterium]|nr:MoaD/ThiS family protein [Bacteroidota bacterium]
MKIRVLLFGVLAEEAGRQELELDNVSSLDGLKKQMIAQYPSFADYKFNISVNHALARGNKNLHEGDEVALLPPFAGG